MIELRPYQKEAIQGLRNCILQGKKRLVLCAATGAGKTVMFTFMIASAVSKNKKCLILTDRIELLTQAGGTMAEFGLKPIEINSKRKLSSLNGILYVGMAQTIIRRLKDPMYVDFFKSLDVIICDESHKQSFNSIMPYILDNTIVIGATATPHREGNQTSMDEFYSDIVEVIKISELIGLGYLATPKSYGVKVDLSGIRTKNGDYDEKQMGDKFNEIELFHGVYENYQRLTPNKKAIIFAPNVESSKVLVNDFKEKGLPIEHIDANTPDADRKRILKWYKSTHNAMISNVGILNAGFDCPDIDVVILYRATKSLPLFLQMCGRGSRTTKTKKQFTILDFGNNIKRHGFWEDDREWSLKKKPKKDGVAPIKECDCGAMLPVSVMTCPECGFEFEPTEKEIKEKVIAELQLLTHQQIKDKVKTANFQELHDIADAKGYKRQWVYYHLKTEKDLNEYARFMNYNKKWVEHQLQIRKQNATN